MSQMYSLPNLILSKCKALQELKHDKALRSTKGLQ